MHHNYPPLSAIEKRFTELQSELLKIATSNADYEKAIIYADKFPVEFKYGVMVDVNE